MFGNVVRLLKDKQFGFIQGSDGIEYFFHKEDCYDSWDIISKEVTTKNNVKVSFEEIKNYKKGPRARNVIYLEN